MFTNIFFCHYTQLIKTKSDMNATNAEQSREGPDNGGMPGSASKRGMKRKLESKTF
jgi:hypothetical protein